MVICVEFTCCACDLFNPLLSQKITMLKLLNPVYKMTLLQSPAYWVIGMFPRNETPDIIIFD